MRVICTTGPEQARGAERLASLASRGLTTYHRERGDDRAGGARCPRCGGGLGPALRRQAPGFFCRCPVRRMRAAAA